MIPTRTFDEYFIRTFLVEPYDISSPLRNQVFDILFFLIVSSHINRTSSVLVMLKLENVFLITDSITVFSNMLESVIVIFFQREALIESQLIRLYEKSVSYAKSVF